MAYDPSTSIRLPFEQVEDPDRLYVTSRCTHRHCAFTRDYDYECLACGQRFDEPWYDDEWNSDEEEAALPHIDFEDLKAANPIEDVAKRLGLQLTKRGPSLRGPCPSGEGGERALAITPSKQV